MLILLFIIFSIILHTSPTYIKSRKYSSLPSNGCTFPVSFASYQAAMPKFDKAMKGLSDKDIKDAMIYGTAGEIVDDDYNKLIDELEIDFFIKDEHKNNIEVATDKFFTKNVRVEHNRTSNTVIVVTSFKEEVSAGVVEPVINRYSFETSEAENIFEALKKLFSEK